MQLMNHPQSGGGGIFIDIDGVIQAHWVLVTKLPKAVLIVLTGIAIASVHSMLVAIKACTHHWVPRILAVGPRKCGGKIGTRQTLASRMV
jgi:hypothetical protein